MNILVIVSLFGGFFGTLYMLYSIGPKLFKYYIGCSIVLLSIGTLICCTVIRFQESKVEKNKNIVLAIKNKTKVFIPHLQELRTLDSISYDSTKVYSNNKYFYVNQVSL